MKAVFVLVLLCAMQLVQAQFSVDLILTQDNSEDKEFSVEQGRICLDIVGSNLRVYAEDVNGNQSDLFNGKLDSIQSFSFLSRPGEWLLLVATNIYHATQTFMSQEKIMIDGQEKGWSVTLSSGDIQHVDVSQLRTLTVENIGWQESDIASIAGQENVVVVIGRNNFTIKGKEGVVGRVDVYSLSGQLLLNRCSSLPELQVWHNLPTGMYIIRNGSHAEKILL